MAKRPNNSNPPITKIEDGLYLGDSVSSRRRNILQDHNIIAVVSLCAGRWVQWHQPWYKKIILEGNHLYIPCNDSMTHDLLPDLAGICNFIHSHRNSEFSNVSNVEPSSNVSNVESSSNVSNVEPSSNVSNVESSNVSNTQSFIIPGVLVHCDRGMSRSATALIAYLMRTHRLCFSDALASVKEKRHIKPNQNFKEQLQVWEAVGYEIWEDFEGRIPKAEYAAYLAKRAIRLEERGLTGNEPIGLQSLS